MSELAFPAGFVWGAGTAAYQIEGATAADGRTDSIWDVFSRMPTATAGGDTGDLACDHYRLFGEDVRRMADLGLNTYRFSVAWPRIRPDGGPVNPAGLAFYDRLVDALLTAGITPWVTLYHWDLPQRLEDRGGWTVRDTAYRFADHVTSVAAALGDRVQHWATLNEPWCSAFVGYAEGRHAPGRTEPRSAVAAAHHLLVAHGLGLEALRAAAPTARAGIVLNLFPVRPADPDDPADLEAARRIDGIQNRLFLDPVLRGAYPPDVLADLAPYGLPELIRDGDSDLIGAPMDLLGINFYRDLHVSGHPSTDHTTEPSPWVGAEHVSFPARDLPHTASGWDVAPDALTDLLLRLHHEYPRIPLYITENGAAYPDTLGADGIVADHDRIAFLNSHLRAAHRALQAGVDLRGYLHWSLLDNFEWAEGYAKRFGLVHVDYRTQRRTPKLSAHWFSRVVAANGLPEPIPAE